MIYDFHVHTSQYSSCSVSTAEELCTQALKAGLDGIALTEHDIVWDEDEFFELKDRFPQLTIFRGMEYSCPEGHFLIFLPEGNPYALEYDLSIRTLSPIVHEENGIVIWAHPFRYDRHLPQWLDAIDIDGLEVESGNMDRTATAMAQMIAEEKRLCPFRNSDAHHLDALGHYFNEVPVRLHNTTDVIEYIQNTTTS